jgi:aminoglycoside phosphotransferase (APT) family kinase protein
MVDHDEIPSYLQTLSAAIKHELLPELQTDHARNTAENLVLLVNRLIGQLAQGEQIAAQGLQQWQRLAAELLDANAVPPAGPAATERLETLWRALQQQMRAPEVRARMLSAAAKPWFRAAAQQSLNFMEALESASLIATREVERTALAQDPAQLRTGLNSYLHSKFPALGANAVEEVRLLAGGSTKLTARVTLGPNTVFPPQIILRMDLPASFTGIPVATEYPIQARVAGLGVLAPAPYLLEEDASFLGGPFMLMQVIPDSVSGGPPMEDDRKSIPRTTGSEFGAELATQLAKLHVLTAEGFTAESERALLLSQIEMERQQWLSRAQPRNSLVTDLCFAWIEANPLPPGRPRALVHGDVSLQNLLVRNGHLSAIIDWELAHRGDPAEDLAYIRVLFADLIDWPAFVNSYTAAGGNPVACDPRAVAFFSLWMFLRLGGMVQGARGYFLDGQRRDPLNARIATHSMDRMLLYQARVLAMVTAPAAAAADAVL